MTNNLRLMDIMVAGPKRQYQDILVYNELYHLTRNVNGVLPDENARLSSSLEGLMNVYDRLYNYGFSLAGYQFIGLAVSSINDSIMLFDQCAFFLLSCGFVTSCFSALLSFCMYEYLNGIRMESNEFIISGMETHRLWLFLPHPLLLANTGLFILPFNMLIHNMLMPYFAIAMNVLSLLLCSGFYVHRRMIVDAQKYDTIMHSEQTTINEGSSNNDTTEHVRVAPLVLVRRINDPVNRNLSSRGKKNVRF